MKEDKELQKEGEKVFNKAKWLNSLLEMKENLSGYKQNISINVELIGHKFHELLKQDFTRKEALEIIMYTNIFG